MINSHLLMIGCGNMGRALLKGWLQADALKSFQLSVVTRHMPEAADKFKNVTYETELSEITSPPALIILAVKPQQLDAVLSNCKKQLGNEPVYLSIAAGVTLEHMQNILDADAKIIRAMPNTPTEVLKGVTALCANPAVESETHGLVTKLFSALGLAVWVKEEEMDAITALCGSGPAYVYYFTECLAEAAKHLGITSVDADRLARQMLLGASTLAAETSKPLHTLRKEVTSPNGTTEAALNIWMQTNTLEEQAKQALQAAYKRARELAGNK